MNILANFVFENDGRLKQNTRKALPKRGKHNFESICDYNEKQTTVAKKLYFSGGILILLVFAHQIIHIGPKGVILSQN